MRVENIFIDEDELVKAGYNQSIINYYIVG